MKIQVTKNLRSICVQESQYLISAIMFYTRIPAPANSTHSEEILNRSRKYFPLIGIIIGLIVSIVFLICSQVFPISISIALSMTASILATGAFHEDGFADSCDGLGGGWQKEQVLIIMKDSRVGTYAVVGLVTLLTIKFLSLLEIAQQSYLILATCMIAAHTVSRFLSSVTIELYTYVQDIDSSKVKPITSKRLSKNDFIITFLISLAPVALLSYLAFLPTLLAITCALLGAYIFASYSNLRIGGYTGDILGAIQQICEVTFYLAFIAAL